MQVFDIDFSLPSFSGSWHIGSGSASEKVSRRSMLLFSQTAGCVEHQTPFHGISCRGEQWCGSLVAISWAVRIGEIGPTEGGKHHMFCLFMVAQDELPSLRNFKSLFNFVKNQESVIDLYPCFLRNALEALVFLVRNKMRSSLSI